MIDVNTLYGFGFLDLAAEPIILSVPDSHGRYYMVEIVDFWTNAFVRRAHARIHVEHDALRWTTTMNSVNPLARKIGESG